MNAALLQFRTLPNQKMARSFLFVRGVLAYPGASPVD
jgi:hypothetical protein